MSGWQWLFIIEGFLGLLLSLIFSLLLPRSTENPTAYLLRGYFTDREKYIIGRRLALEDVGGGHEKAGKNVTRAEVKKVVSLVVKRFYLFSIYPMFWLPGWGISFDYVNLALHACLVKEKTKKKTSPADALNP